LIFIYPSTIEKATNVVINFIVYNSLINISQHI